MKRLLAVALLCAVALFMVAGSASATPGYHYEWTTVYWGSADSSYFYIPSGASIAIKNSSVITLPSNTYWPAPADSIPLFIVVGAQSGAGAATDTLMLDYQWTFDGTNFFPDLDWDKDAQVLVGAGTYWSFRFLSAAGAQPAYTAAGTGDWAAGVPNTYRFTIPQKGATGMRLVIHPSHASWTGNRTVRAKIGICVSNQY